MNSRTCHRLLFGLVLLLSLAGCTTRYYRRSADKEVYGIIKAKSPLVWNMDRDFTVEQRDVGLPEGLPVATEAPDFLGPYGEGERGAKILGLKEALGIAVHTSRAYQSRKEDLYLATLQLTLVRHQFTPIYAAEVQVNYGTQIVEPVDQATDAVNPPLSDRLVEQGKVQAQGTVFGATWLIRNVGRITTALTGDFIRFVSGGVGSLSGSQLSTSFTRPLVRDAGFKREMEALTQAERTVLYDLRDFTQYRKEFTVQVASAYYGVLGIRDAVRNNYLNLRSSRKNAERSRALAKEGRITQSDLGRLEQQELSAESTWINAVRGYKQALDNFKLQLGVDVDANLVLDSHELEALSIQNPGLSVEDSIQVALTARLDYLNTKDQFEDAVRQVDLTINLLKPQVDLGANVTLNSNPNRDTGVQWPDLQRYSWTAGLSVDPGLDRQAERNAYRSALITRNRAARAMTQKEDDIKVQVRDSWRTLEQARSNYEISEIGVKVAKRRVEEQNLLAELGRAKAQDQVDAQNSLSDSENQRTQALVTHTIARLQFWNNLGILYVKEDGQWKEVQSAQAR